MEHLSKTFNPTLTLLKGASCASQVFTFTRVTDGDTVALGVPNKRMTADDLIYTAWVSAPSKITLRVCAFDTKPPNFGSCSIRVDIWKH